MVRHHGWQLPAHTFQVVAITVFFLLAVAFYAFFAPFLGNQILQYVAIAIYTPVAFAVFILYIRATRINPADPGIMDKFNEVFSAPNNSNNPRNQDVNLPDNFANNGNWVQSSPSSMCASSIDGHSSVRGNGGVVGNTITPTISSKRKPICCGLMGLGGLLCYTFAKEDCRKGVQTVDPNNPGEDALFCTLCNSEVQPFSKHCRSCDKCVDGFDHHCRWLNNCVGRKNYITFISLMATSLVWLVIEFGVGTAVMVLCFVDKKGTETNIIDKLGNGFSRAPFATVVAICTAVSLLAIIPLGELFFFHLLLIKKGITTYEFVVAMRAMSEPPPESVNDDVQNILYSPSGSATTGISRGSSMGFHLDYKGVWCTPPRVFVDQQDEVIPHLEPGMIPSTVDPDASASGNKQPKKTVKISTWKLAKLDSTEAMKAAAKARASSSVLRPMDATRRALDSQTDVSSSLNGSVRSSDYGQNQSHHRGGRGGSRNLDRIPSPLQYSYPPSQTSRDDYETGTHDSMSSMSSPCRMHEPIALSLIPDRRNIIPRQPQPPQPPPPVLTTNPMFHSSRRPFVVWDQESGRYVSANATRPDVVDFPGRAAINSHHQRPIWTNPSPANANTFPRRPPQPPNFPESLPPSVRSPLQQQHERSIFFGGPLLSAPVRDAIGNTTTPASRLHPSSNSK